MGRAVQGNGGVTTPPPARPQTGAPLVSVLLPFYRAGSTLASCLDSLLNQTLTDLEIIAVDDGSHEVVGGDGEAGEAIVDEGPRIAAEFARLDPRVRVLARPHQGIVSALNAGLAACRGTYVARMDADDVALPERVALQRDYLEHHPECDLVGALVEPFRDDGRPGDGVVRYHAWMNRQVAPEAIRASMFVESPLPHPAFFARRSFFEDMGGYQDPPWPEDYDLLHRAMAKGSIFGKVPRVLVRRRDHAARLTRTDARYKRDAMLKAKAHYFAKGSWLHGRTGVVIGGSGSTGRKMAALLQAEGVKVLCFLDNRIGPPNRRVHGLPAFGYPDDIPADFFEGHREAFFLACIGQEEGQERLVRHLHHHGFAQEHDYLRIM